MNIGDAYAACEEITRREARNFYYGIRLLPPPKRRAMSALYAVARRIDDVGDGPGAAEEKLATLRHLRKDIVAAGSPDGAHHGPPDGVTDDAVMVALADVTRHYPLPLTALEELVEGCEMDVNGARYETFEELVGYCRRVAGTVGRLSLAIYGCTDPLAGEGIADDLGVALQLTNILRDIVEDRLMGRVYLPAQDLARFGCRADATGPPEAMTALVSYQAAIAEDWYSRGLRLLPMLDWRSRACTAAMAGIYHRLLRHIEMDPQAVLSERVSLPPWQKAAVAARALAGAKI